MLSLFVWEVLFPSLLFSVLFFLFIRQPFLKGLLFLFVFGGLMRAQSTSFCLFYFQLQKIKKMPVNTSLLKTIEHIRLFTCLIFQLIGLTKERKEKEEDIQPGVNHVSAPPARRRRRRKKPKLSYY